LPPAATAEPKELQTVNVPAIEIMAAGTWNGDEYTRADLDEMVRAFDELRGKIDPPVKLGHDEGQKLAQKDGYPALGWVERVYRKGATLVADLRDVPERVAKLITAGAYQKVSSEIYFDKEVDGTTYPFVLKAISLLGGDMPAVKDIRSIGDIEGLYADGQLVALLRHDESDMKNVRTVQRVRALSTVPQLSIGDRVRVRDGMEHDMMTRGASGVIVEVSTPALGIRFDAMPSMVHRWYTESEVELDDGTEAASGQRPRMLSTTIPDGMSLDNFQAALRTAVSALPGVETDHIWVADVVDDSVVVSIEDSYVRYPFSIDTTGTVTITGQGTTVTRSTTWQPTTTDLKEDEMELKTLAEKLGLPADATEEQVNTKLAELTAPNDGQTQKPAPKDDPAGAKTYSEDDVRKLNERVADLERERTEDRVSRLIDDGIKDGKLTMAERPHLVGWATKDFEGAKKYIDGRPKLAIFSGPLGADGASAGDGKVELGPAGKEAQKQLGVSDKMLDEYGSKPLSELVEEHKDKIGSTGLSVDRSRDRVREQVGV